MTFDDSTSQPKTTAVSVASYFLRYGVYGGGKVLPGLLAMRIAEILILTADQ